MLKPTLRKWLILAFWLLAHLPALLMIIIIKGDDVLFAYAFAILPALAWGWGLHAALATCAQENPEISDYKIGWRLRSFFYMTVPTLFALSTYLLSLLFSELNFYRGSISFDLLSTGIVWLFCIGYWLIGDFSSKKGERPRLTFTRMQSLIVTASLVTFATVVISIAGIFRFNINNDSAALASLFGCLFSLYGIIYFGFIHLYRHSHKQERTKLRWRKPLIWAVSLAIFAVIIGQQWVTFAEYNTPIVRAIEDREEKKVQLKRFRDNLGAFRAETEKAKSHLNKLEKELPTYRGKPEPFDRSAESIFLQKNLLIKERLTEANNKGFYIEHLFAWRIQGRPENIRQALHEIDASSRLISWVYLPLDLSAPPQKVEAIVALNIYNIYAPPSDLPNSNELTVEHNQDAPWVWLPPFSWLTEEATNRSNAYRLIQEISPYAQELNEFQRIKKKLHTGLDIHEKLDTNGMKLSEFFPGSAEEQSANQRSRTTQHIDAEQYRLNFERRAEQSRLKLEEKFKSLREHQDKSRT